VSADRELGILFEQTEQPAEKAEQTLALFKPDVSGDESTCDKIRSLIRKEGFSIVEEKHIWLSSDDAALFYKEHSEKSFFASIIEFMTWYLKLFRVLMKC
jgi:nucleoside-diphosphate kinase